MPTAKFTYTGIRTAIALPPEKEGEPPRDVPLIPHQEVELPDDMAIVQRMERQGVLQRLEAPKPKARKAAEEASS